VLDKHQLIRHVIVAPVGSSTSDALKA